jgi:ABC-2 type transport system permease protein
VLAGSVAAWWRPGIVRSDPDGPDLNWAVVAGRAATSSSPRWGLVFSRLGFLAALMVLCLTFATRAFRAYQRSV